MVNVEKNHNGSHSWEIYIFIFRHTVFKKKIAFFITVSAIIDNNTSSKTFLPRQKKNYFGCYIILDKIIPGLTKTS